MIRIRTLLAKHRQSGVVIGFLTFFVISYIIIVKLDASDRLKVDTNTEPKETNTASVAKVIRTNKNVIPIQVLAEFAQDEENEKRKDYDFYDENGNYTDYSVDKHRVFLPSFDPKKKSVNSQQHKAVGDFIQKTQSVKTGNAKALIPSKNVVPAFKSARQPHKLVHIFNALKESRTKMEAVMKNKCVELKTLHGTSPICIHNPEDDEIISGKISSQGIWEGNYLYIVGSVLSENPFIEFLDLGCNIGVYTILAAKLGHKVMALDPNKVNLRLLTRSLNMGEIIDKVTLVWNAISNVRENVTLFDIIGNIGGTFIETADETDKEDETIDDEHRAIAITLDDLTEFFKGKQLFIKIDIETYELKALKGGHKFFQQVHVRFVLMEWIYHREFDTGKEVIAFMKRYGMYPHINAHRNTKLDPEFYRTWPDNILWIKY